MTAITLTKLNEPTKNYMRRKLIKHYMSSEETVESILYKGFDGLFNLSDERLIQEELPKIGFYSVEDFERTYAEELGLS